MRNVNSKNRGFVEELNVFLNSTLPEDEAPLLGDINIDSLNEFVW